MPSERVTLRQLTARQGNRGARRLARRAGAAGRRRAARRSAANRPRGRERMSTDTIRLADRMQHVGAVADDEGHDRGGAAAPPGRRRRRSRRGRAGLSDAGARHRGGARGARQQLHEVHGQPGHRRAARGRGAPLPRGLRRRRTRPTKSSSRPAASRRCITRRWRCSGRATKSSRTRRAGRRIVEQIKLAGATPVDRAHARRGWLRADAPTRCSRRVTPRTRGIVINSPGNPTGALLSEAEAREARGRGGAARICGS